MSNSEGDIDDELLALLAGEGGSQEKKRKKSSSRQGQQGGSGLKKKRKVSMESDSEEPESEEDTDLNPYPLEGKYIDDEDRDRLLDMNEMERESIIASRLEEMQKMVDKRNLDQMLRENRGDGGDSVAKAAKRQHAQRGVTKEKTRKLDELKAKRKAKDDKKRTRGNSPKRDRSSSPMDMETSDEEEDGQISKLEQEDLLLEKEKQKDEPATVADFRSCQVTRDMLVKHCLSPWFEEYTKGGWVRYMVGIDNETKLPKYRICEISSIKKSEKTYKLDEKTTTDWVFELKHAKSLKTFTGELISNASFTDREFDRLKIIFEMEKEKLPTKAEVLKKATHLIEVSNRSLTESDLAHILNRKRTLNANSGTQAAQLSVERNRLNQQRTLAYNRGDSQEVAEVDSKLQDIGRKLEEMSHNNRTDAGGAKKALTSQDMLAQVNERNRKANQDAVRKSEMMEAERKRRERKMGAAPGSLAPVDPSARLRTVARVFNSAAPVSRPSTPAIPSAGPASGASTPVRKETSVSPLKQSKALESSFLASIEVDLGDF